MDILTNSQLQTHFDQCLRYIGEHAGVYVMSIQHENLQSELHSFALNIHSKINRLQDCNPSINESSFYVGASCSVTPVHCENGFLESANSLTYGPNYGYKMWLFIHPAYNNYLNKLINLTVVS